MSVLIDGFVNNLFEVNFKARERKKQKKNVINF